MFEEQAARAGASAGLTRGHGATRKRFASSSLLVPAFDLLALTGGGLSVPAFSTGAQVAYVALALLLLGGAGSWRPRISLRVADDLTRLLCGVAVPVVVIAVLPGWSGALAGLAQVVPVTAGLLLLARTTSYGLIRVCRLRGEAERTVIVGAGRVGVELAELLQTHREYGMMPIGFLDGFDGADLPLPVLGNLDAMDTALADHDVGRVIVAFGAHREPNMVRIFRACTRAKVEVYVVPRFFELAVAPCCPNTDDIWGIPVVRLKGSALRSPSWRMKRAFDIVVASAALAVCAPLMGLIALGVRLTSPGPVLFRQTRVGIGGRVVEVLKFRTLTVNDDSDTTWSVVGDSRQTPLGRFLRRTSLDELPQLFNVLRGEMSLVGPRPERPHFVQQFKASITGYDDRHRVPVGITGWAQVHGLRGETSLVERARFDNHYIEYWSLWTDLVILVRTFAATFRDFLASGRRQAASDCSSAGSVAGTDGLSPSLPA